MLFHSSAMPESADLLTRVSKRVAERNLVMIAWSLAPLAVITVAVPQVALAAFVVWLGVSMGLAVAGESNPKVPDSKRRRAVAPLVVSLPPVAGYWYSIAADTIYPAVVGALVATALTVAFLVVSARRQAGRDHFRL